MALRPYDLQTPFAHGPTGHATLDARIEHRLASGTGRSGFDAAFRRKSIMYEEKATTEAAFTDARLELDRATAVLAQTAVTLKIARERGCPLTEGGRLVWYPCWPRNVYGKPRRRGAGSVLETMKFN